MFEGRPGYASFRKSPESEPVEIVNANGFVPRSTSGE